jgi:hypothetical protein
VATNKGLTKRQEGTPPTPPKRTQDGYWSQFGEKIPSTGYSRPAPKNRSKKDEEEQASRRRQGYEWIFE